MRKTNSSSSHKKQSKILKKKNKDKQRKKKSLNQKISLKQIEKQVIASLNAIENLISSIPSTCVHCDSKFDSKNDDHLDRWKMSMSDSGVILECDQCQGKITKPDDLNDLIKEN